MPMMATSNSPPCWSSCSCCSCSCCSRICLPVDERTACSVWRVCRSLTKTRLGDIIELRPRAPSGLGTSPTSPKDWGRLSVRRVRGSTTPHSNWRPTGAPPGPPPAPSPLVPRGEGTSSIAHRSSPGLSPDPLVRRLDSWHRAAPGAAPSPRPPPPLRGRGGEFDRAPAPRLRPGASPFPHAVCGGGPGMGGGPPSRTSLPNRPISPHPNLPRQFRGRWAGGAGPEGACAELSEAPRLLPRPLPPHHLAAAAAALAAASARPRRRRARRSAGPHPPAAVDPGARPGRRRWGTGTAPPPSPRAPAPRQPLLHPRHEHASGRRSRRSCRPAPRSLIPSTSSHTFAMRRSTRALRAGGGARLGGGRGERLAVHLAVGASAGARPSPRRRPAPCSPGSRLAQVRAQLGADGRLRAVRGGQVGHQPRRRRSRAQHHGGLRHARGAPAAPPRSRPTSMR